jgi:hypothetical protein
MSIFDASTVKTSISENDEIINRNTNEEGNISIISSMTENGESSFQKDTMNHDHDIKKENSNEIKLIVDDEVGPIAISSRNRSSKNSNIFSGGGKLSVIRNVSSREESFNITEHREKSSENIICTMREFSHVNNTGKRSLLFYSKLTTLTQRPPGTMFRVTRYDFNCFRPVFLYNL